MNDAEDIIKKLNQFVVNTEKAIDDSVRVTAYKVQNAAIKAIRSPSMGTITFKKGIEHIVSKEGTAPNTDTGNLVGSIKTEHKKLSMTAVVGSRVEYGAYLELLLNRPWLEPALEDNISTYQATLKKVVEKQIRDANK